MSTQFRQMAREALKRAKSELASTDNERIKYAALELRLAMEAITYDRALAFKTEIPPNEYRTWQPRKLMQVLHGIDPKIGLTSSIAFGLEQSPGILAPGEKMHSLGTDTVLTLDDLKLHYDAIGSVLHMGSLKQVEQDKTPSAEATRARCDTVVSLLEKVLASPVWNSTFGNFAELTCERCKKRVRKRIPLGIKEVEAKCFECGAEYVVKDVGAGKVFWLPKQQTITCPTDGCGQDMVIWADEIHVDTCWTCTKCQQSYIIGLAIRPDPTGQV